MRHSPLCRFLPAVWLMLWVVVATAALAAPTTVLVLGDSLAAGLGVERDEAFPALLEAKAKAEDLSAEVVNAGISGDTSAGGRGRINWLLNRKIDVLVLELGANDGLRGIPPESTTENLQAIIDAAKTKYPDIKIIIVGMKMPPNLGPDYGEKFEQIFPRLAADNQALLVPYLLENVGGIAEMNLEDRIHPNPRGHRHLAENVWKILGPLLRSITAE